MRLLRHLKAWLRRSRLDDELRGELAQHAAWKAEALIDEGVPAAEARRRAAIEIGNMTRLREQSRDVWGFPTIESIVQDLQYGARLLRRSPGFSAVAILSLAVGIGATGGVFSLADAMLFRELPVPDPQSLVVFKWTSGPVFPFSNLNGFADQRNDGLASTSFSQTAFETFRSEGARYVDVTGFADVDAVSMAIDGRAEIGSAHAVDGRFFSVLGVVAAAGRTLQPDDNRPDAPPAAVISHAYWMRRFGGAGDAVGRAIAINAAPFTIAGVLPAGFRGTGQVGTYPDVYVPFAQRPLLVPDDDSADNPNYWWVLMMGRLKPGVGTEDARAALDVLLKRTVAAAKPDLAAKDLPRLQLAPGARGQEEMRAPMREILATMGWVTGIVLLVACANLANLLLARGRARVREIAVRVAIGAPRGRVVRQMFTEAALIAAAGSALGVVIARWISQALLPALASGPDPLVADLTLDWRFLLFVAALGSAAAIVFGLLPALRSTDLHLAEGLEETRRGNTATRQRRLLTGGLVAVQIALSLLLLTGAGLLVRSVRNLERANVGFNPENVLLFQIDPALNNYKPEQAHQLYAAVLERLRATPGVRSAALSSYRLISNSSSYTSAFRTDEVPPDPASPQARSFRREHGAYMHPVDGQFFATMEIPLIRGQAFTDADAGGERVAVISHALAQRLYGTDDAVGRLVRVGPGRRAETYRITGVSADARFASLRRPVEPTAYLLYSQPPFSSRGMTFEVRTAGEPAALAATVREIVRQLDSALPVSRVGTQREQIARSVATERMFARLATLLGLIALALAAIGLYGLLAYSVVQRTAEIGIRMALGAARGAVRWMILRESLVLVGIGLLAGIPAALAGTKVLESFLYELPARDPWTLAAAASFLVALALSAALIPARRASNVDPIVALRTE